MSSTALKVAAIIGLLVTLLLAIVGFTMSQNYAARTQHAEAEVAKAAADKLAPQTFAVVALKPLAAYQPIKRGDIALVAVAVTPTDYFANPDEVSARVPLVDIDAGAPVTRRYFKQGNILAKIIPVGHQAVALEVNEVIAAGGFVRPGDNVDVLVYFHSGPGVTDPQARVLLNNARVLAYEERIIERPQGLKDEESKSDVNRRRIRTAVIAVPDADTTRVMLGINLGEVRLALRGQQTTAAEEAGASTSGGDLPLTNKAGDDMADQMKSDKVVTATELARVKLRSAVEKKNAEAPREMVEVIHGSQSEKVAQ